MVRDGTPPGWRKSTFSATGDCVEWLAVEDNVYVRDSKQPCGAVLVFTRAKWLVFIAGIKSRSGGPAY
jgi:uncharacterized protein DUF397